MMNGMNLTPGLIFLVSSKAQIIYKLARHFNFGGEILLKLAQSGRNRTCCECDETINKGILHAELWGGPETDYNGFRNGWVTFAHIECVKTAVSGRAIRVARRRYSRERRHEKFWRA